MTDRYRQLFMSFGDAVFVEDAAGVIVDANDTAARLLELPVTELIGKKASEFLSPVSIERILPQRQGLKPNQHLQFDAQYTSKSGKPINVILDLSLVLREDPPEAGEQPAAPLYLAVARPSSKLDELERELRLQRQSALGGFGNITRQVFFISKRNEISPYPPMAPGEPARPLDWVHTLLLGPRLKPAVERAWLGHEVTLPAAWYNPSEGGEWHASYSGIHEAIKPAVPVRQRWLQMIILPLKLRGSDVSDLCVRVLDWTSERLAQEANRRVEQRIATSLLTSALHHELNNFLSVIMAQASGLRLSTPQGQLPPPNVGAVIDAAQNAAGLLRRAADMGLRNEGVLHDVDINALVVDCANLLPHLAHGRITVETDITPDLPVVRGDAYALKTMLLSLSHHAEASIPFGGKLTIRTSRCKDAFPGLPPGICIALQDNNGHSSRPQANLATTIGGSGETLELALARAIVREHRGQLESESSSSQGHVWEVTLPAVETRPPVDEKSPPDVADLPDEETMDAQLKGSAREGVNADRIPVTVRTPPILSAVSTGQNRQHRRRILLADDEENFRAFTSWVLKEHGYDVVTANDGQEAFDRFQEAPPSFNLVILDAYMPRMGGLESYLRMQVLRPDLPVLFASGFVRGPSVEALVDGCPGPAGVLLKPFSSEDLLKAVDKALAPADAE